MNSRNKIFFLIFVLLLLSAVVNSQEKPEAYKFDEFSNLPESEWEKRLDRFSEVKTAFPDSSLYLIVYAQTGKSRSSIIQLGKRQKGYLLVVKRVKPVYFELGGLRASQTTELWVVPKNANFPKPMPDEGFKAEIFSRLKDANDEKVEIMMEKYLVALQSVPSDSAYIINYGSPEEVDRREKQIRDSLKFRKFPSSQITIVNANGVILETVFWIVPQGAKPPTP